MSDVSNMISRVVRFAGEVVAETLWPTRCAVCDAPGAVLCEKCKRTLPYIDWWRACRRCGCEYGLVQCDACNPVALGRIGRSRLPFAACASATSFTNESGRVVRIYKDHGEQRLAGEMAAAMARTVPRDWTFDSVTFVPATLRAHRERGFDHGELLATRVAEALDVALAHTLAPPKTRDQRDLSGSERVANLGSAFTASGERIEGGRFVLVDDVFTTGSTLCAATDALLLAGAREVYCLTFTRV